MIVSTYIKNRVPSAREPTYEEYHQGDFLPAILIHLNKHMSQKCRQDQNQPWHPNQSTIRFLGTKVLESRMTRPGRRAPLPRAWPATILVPFGLPRLPDGCAHRTRS
jgi:hypothetical protein